jgi:proteic killer suppression protein
VAIKSCKDKKTERFLAGERVKEFEGCAEKARRCLTKLQAAHKFKALEADRKGQYSIWINDQWRLCFRWVPHAANPEDVDILQTTGDCLDVEIVDYH